MGKGFKAIRLFGGKRFVKHTNSFETKSLARKESNFLHKEGFLTRIVIAPMSFGKYWLVYKRKKR